MTQPKDNTKKKCPDCNGLPGLYPKNRCPACHVKSNIGNDNTDRLDEIFEYFVQERDTGFNKIHERYLKGEITIEEQVELSEVDWNKHLAEAKQALLQWVADEIIGEDMQGEDCVDKELSDKLAYGAYRANCVRIAQRAILKQHGFKEGE